MKITKSTLRKIIKEELTKVLNEFDRAVEEPEAELDDWRGLHSPGDTGRTDMPVSGLEWEPTGPTQSLSGDPESALGPGQTANPYEKLNTDLARWNRGLPAGRVEAKKMINQMHRDGKISKDTWRQARRALYRSEDEAREIVQRETGAGVQDFAAGLGEKPMRDVPELPGRPGRGLAGSVEKHPFARGGSAGPRSLAGTDETN